MRQPNKPNKLLAICLFACLRVFGYKESYIGSIIDYLAFVLKTINFIIRMIFKQINVTVPTGSLQYIPLVYI